MTVPKKSKRAHAIDMFGNVAKDYHQLLLNLIDQVEWLDSSQKTHLRNLFQIAYINYLDPKIAILKKGIG